MARIALDIDSTLHHYWDLLDELARRRYGVALPYAEQTGWDITELSSQALKALVSETHAEHHVLAAEPYPGAVDAIRRWHDAGHWIHITSHRAEAARYATERWLENVGIPYDDLHCSYDKVTRCVSLDIALLIDDSPVNLRRAREEGIAGATIIHPWNAELVERGEVVGARDWPTLAERLQPVLGI